jgi:DNA-binding XRE family transcriptional regulator
MPAAVKTRPISLRFKPRTPRRIILRVREQFADYVIDEPEDSDNWFESDLHKEIAARMTPGKYLRHFREAHGLTQKAMGDKVGVGPNYVSDWENGQRPISRFAARKLGEMFNVNPGVFI